MPKAPSWRQGWQEISSQSLLLLLLLPPVLGLLYPLYLQWPLSTAGFWNHRSEFLAMCLPYALAFASLHLLGSWEWYLRQTHARYAFLHFHLGRHLLGVGLGGLLAGQLFARLAPWGLKPASLGLGLGLYAAALLRLSWPLRKQPEWKQKLASPWLPLWAVLHSLSLILYFSPLRLAGIGFWLLSLLILPLTVAPWQGGASAEAAIPWRRVLGLACAGLLLTGGMYVWLKRDIRQQEQRLDAVRLSLLESLRFERPLLRGQPLAENGFTGYWSILGNHCNLSGTQPGFGVENTDSYRVRSMFDLYTGVLVPDPELLERYRPQIARLAEASQARSMQYPFAAYLHTCQQDLPVPNLGTMQDMLLLRLAQGLYTCNHGNCLLGAQQAFDALRAAQDLSVYGQVVPVMVGYKVERIIISALGTRLHPADLSPAQWHRLLGEWRALLAGEAGLFRQVLDQEMLLAQKSLYNILSEDEVPNILNFPVQLAIFPFVVHGQPDLLQLTRRADAYLDATAHDTAKWAALNDIQKSAAKRNPFVNNVLIDVVLASQRFREHQMVLRGFYQHLALQAYFAARGHYPARLQELVPEWIPALPADPYTGKPFVYRLSELGFELYSLGDNQRDDGGDGYYGNFLRSDTCSGKELVFAPRSPARCQS